MKGLVMCMTGNVSRAWGYHRQAEKTLESYGGKKQGKAKGGRRPPHCFGCKSLEHVFSRNGKIICPRGHTTAIKAAADAKFEEIANRPGKLTATQERWRKHDPDLDDFTGASLKKIKK